MPILFVSFTIQDADGDQARSGFEFVPDIPISSDDLLTIAEGIWAVVLPLTNGMRVSMDVSTGVRIYSDTPAEITADVQEAADFFFRDTYGNNSETGIPCFRENLFEGAGADKTVDLTSPVVQAFVQMMIDGYPLDGNGNKLRHVTMHGTVVNALREAKQAWRPRKKKRWFS